MGDADAVQWPVGRQMLREGKGRTGDKLLPVHPLPCTQVLPFKASAPPMRTARAVLGPIVDYHILESENSRTRLRLFNHSQYALRTLYNLEH